MRVNPRKGVHGSCPTEDLSSEVHGGRNSVIDRQGQNGSVASLVLKGRIAEVSLSVGRRYHEQYSISLGRV